MPSKVLCIICSEMHAIQIWHSHDHWFCKGDIIYVGLDAAIVLNAEMAKQFLLRLVVKKGIKEGHEMRRNELCLSAYFLSRLLGL